MLIPLVPTPLYYLPSMRFVFLNSGIRQQAHIVVHIEVEQGTRLSARFVDDEVIKSVMLVCSSAYGLVNMYT